MQDLNPEFTIGTVFLTGLCYSSLDRDLMNQFRVCSMYWKYSSWTLQGSTENII